VIDEWIQTFSKSFLIPIRNFRNSGLISQDYFDLLTWVKLHSHFEINWRILHCENDSRRNRSEKTLNAKYVLVKHRKFRYWMFFKDMKNLKRSHHSKQSNPMKFNPYLRNRFLFFFCIGPMAKLKEVTLNWDWKENQSLAPKKLLLHFRKRKKSSLFTSTRIPITGWFPHTEEMLKIISRKAEVFWVTGSKISHGLKAANLGSKFDAVVLNNNLF